MLHPKDTDQELTLWCNTRYQSRVMWKRDIQGKFALKDDDYRQVRSLRVTDETWKAMGIAAECFGMTRADYLEQVIRDNASPSITWTLETIHQAQTTVAELATTPLSVATLETLRDQVLLQLKLGKQAPGYKATLKALNHFIAALTDQYTQESE